MSNGTGATGLHNGAVWQAPNLLRVVLTWIDGEQWVLMSAPERSRHGGFCMIAHCDSKGQWLWDADQLKGRLVDWTYLPNETLMGLGQKSGA